MDIIWWWCVVDRFADYVHYCLARALDLRSCLLYELYLYFLNTYMLWNISLCHIVHLYK